jgi:hypothetical protein
MSSTFTAPIRVNTRQTTSNDGTISADNTGAAVLTQQKAFVSSAAATVVDRKSTRLNSSHSGSMS